MITMVGQDYVGPIKANMEGKEKMVAMIACARKLLVCINAMVRTGTPWDDKKVTAFFQPPADPAPAVN